MMKPGRSKKAILHTPASYLLVAVLGVAVLGLTQCRMTEQSVTGVDLGTQDTYQRSRLDRCSRRCIASYLDCRHDEKKRHWRALRDCDKLKTWAERKACRDAETKRHRAEKLECREALARCREDCRYNEGGGQGGR